MKIINQTETNLVAVERNTGDGVWGVVWLVIGVLAVIIGALDITDALGSLLLGSFMVVVGIGILLLRRQVSLEIDKSVKQVTLASRSPFGRSQHQYAFEQIAKVSLVTAFNNIQSYMTTLSLVLSNGTTIELTNQEQSIPALNMIGIASKIPNKSIGQSIAQFIGVPLEETDTRLFKGY